MKSLIVVISVFTLSVIANAQGERQEFNQQSGQNNIRAQVEAIASEQGIDMSTSEGRQTMAQYLIQNGKQDLLPRHQQSSGQQGAGPNQQQQGQLPLNGQGCNKQRGGHHRPPMGRMNN